MEKKDKSIKERKTSFLISISILLLGMTAGFILLSFIYTGPVWVRFCVFIVYLFIVSFTIKCSGKYVDELNLIEAEKKSEEKA